MSRRRLSLLGCSLVAAAVTVAAPARQVAAAAARPTARPAAACSNASVVARWSLARQAAQLVVYPVDESDVASAATAVRQGVGGIVLFGSSAPATLGAQLRAAEAQAPGGIRPFVMADEEGGGVQRVANLVGSMPWPRSMAAALSAAQVRQLATTVARKMAANGVTMDLAPVLDIASGPGPDAEHTDGPRSFGPEPATATAYGLAFARGMLAGGVVPVVKHFPGEGRASANTDDAPASTPPLATLERADLLPFEAAIKAGLPAVMVGNATVPGLSALPASISRQVIVGLLRDKLGFGGLVLTDSLSAKALADRGIGVTAASVRAVEAGADMVLFTADAPERQTGQIVAALVAAVHAGSLPTTELRAAVLQVLRAKRLDLCEK